MDFTATMATMTKQERVQRDSDIVRSLRVNVNDIMAGDFPETTKPEIGKPVVVVNDFSGQEWRLIAYGSSGYENTDSMKRRFSYVEYGPFHENGTWILQSSRGKRNPLWTLPELNREGEGEYEQRHAIVLRCRITGHYVFYFFQSREEEIEALERTSGEKIGSHYLNANRTSPARERGERRGIEYDDMPAGHLCCISDYIYFSPEGCQARERFQAATGAKYTTDFDAYAKMQQQQILGILDKTYTATTADLRTVDERVISAILSLEPRISPKKLKRILRTSVLEAYTIAHAATI